MPVSQKRMFPRAQHTWPRPPQASQRRTPPPAAAPQIDPMAVQAALAQQIWPIAPQASHVRAPPAAAAPHSAPAAVHVLPQHVCPRSPHAEHVPFTQVLPVQLRPWAQHAWPSCPQFTHCASGWQLPARQQSPAPLALPGQQS
jgi:hypothetical protein